MFWKKKSIKDLLPPPVKVEHGEYSMIFSARDNPPLLTSSLFNLSLEAIKHAAQVEFKEVSLRNEQSKMYCNIWPGEHYRLLAGFMLALKPKTTIEIGTSTGLSALCLKQYLPPGGKIVTFDIDEWQSYPKTLLKDEDFSDKKLIQYIDDLSVDSEFDRYRLLLQEAEFIFIDASHNGILEEKILSNLKKISFKNKVFILMDDIRVWTMLKTWRNISLPKLDLTSFGHWSGTGLIEFC